MSTVRVVVVLGLLILGLFAIISSHAAAEPSTQALTRIESDHAFVVAQGSWQSVSTPSASGESYLYSSGSRDDALLLRFRGPYLEIITVEHASLGTLVVEIDHVVMRTVALTAEQTRFQVSQTFDYLDDQEHVVRLYAALGVIAVDAFITEPLAPEVAGSISGVVRNAAGTAPLGHVPVQLMTDVGAIDTCSNSDGTYTFTGLMLNQGFRITAGGVMLCGGGTDYYALEYWQETPFYEQATLITLTVSNPTRSNINFTLDVGGMISGRVTEADGVTPIDKMTVYIPELGNWACSAPDGTYSMHGIALNTTFVVGSAPGFLMWCDNGPLPYLGEYWEEVHDIAQATPITLTQAALTRSNINFRLDPGGRITGQVTTAESGTVLGGVFVCTTNYAPYPDFWDCSQTEPDGTFSTMVLPLGNYRVRAYPTWTGQHRLEWFYPTATRFEDAAAVPVTAMTTTQNINFALPVGAIIQGRVYAADGVTPMAGVMVSTADGEYSTCTGGQNVAFGMAVPVGSHILRAASGYCDSTVNFPTQYYNGAGEIANATPIQITSTSQTVNITFRWAVFTTLLEPTGNIITRTPTFRWGQIAGSEWYHLQVKTTANATVHDGWYQVGSQVSCAAGECALHVSTALGNVVGTSALKWFIQPYSAATGLGAWSGPKPFTIIAPSLTGPLGTVYEPLGKPRLRWNHLDGAIQYQVYMVGPGGLVINEWFDAAQCVSGQCSVTLQPLLDVGAYQVYLQAYSADGYGPFGGPFNFTLIATVLGPIGKLAPVNGAVLTSATVEFAWNRDLNAHSFEFYLVGPGGYSTSQRWLATEICGLGGVFSCSVTLTVPSNGPYTWYLRGINAAGGGAWGSPNYGASSFTVTAGVPNIIAKVAPINNAVEQDGNVTFRWQADANAIAYDLYVVGPGGFVNYHLWDAATYCSGADCEVTLRVPREGTYSWYLRGKSAVGYGEWGTPNFGVANFTVDTSVPGEVTKLLPGQGQVVQATRVTLTWQVTDLAEGYEVYLSGPGGFVHYVLHYVGETVNCSAGSCSLTLYVQNNGVYSWYMRAWSPAGFGPWGALPSFGLRSFSVQAPAPTVNATLLAPANGAVITESGAVSFQWNAVDNATWYLHVLVNRNTGAVISQTWVSGVNAGCGAGGICTRTVNMGVGAYRWAVLTWGPGSVGVPVYQAGVTPTWVFDKLAS